MPRQFTLDPILEIDELAGDHRDVMASLRLYFSPLAPNFTTRFWGSDQTR
jgi:hypothetical protein